MRRKSINTEHYDVYSDWITEAGIRPPQSLLGVHRDSGPAPSSSS